MDQGQKEILRMRVVSTAFTTLALAVFKPFGLDAWHWQGYLHLANIFVLGVAVCMLTDALMKYLFRKPVRMDDSRRDVNYFIRRNLYFQIINTLLVTLMICLYRHFVMSDLIAENRLSWSNFFETLLIIAFCSFAIGLYWRFKFRSRYLAEELEEAKLLNEQLQALKPSPVLSHTSEITLSGTTNETVTLQISNLLYIEAVGNYVKVYHLRNGAVRADMLRATSKQMEEKLHDYPMIVRCHRAFLVNLGQVEQVIYKSGSMQLVVRHCPEAIPVSRSKISPIKEAILKNSK
ncbi:MAG: LytTR family transcriptional regulator DNA-binding domain-containing protein [Prevotella sp.]|nr:LytTR family transcriptional regulator DNA-binding domain-containing protein [Prevotella sp.]